MELYPTEKAMALLPRIQEILSDWESYITEGLSGEELALLTKVLSRMKGRAALWTDRL